MTPQTQPSQTRQGALDEIIVLKIGGSLITHKDRRETLDDETLQTIVTAISNADTARPLVLVHGGGSFGHYHADAHGVTTVAGTTDQAATLAIHNAMTTLNRFVLDRLAEQDVPAVPVHPLSMASRGQNGTLSLPTTAIERLLGEGFVPVLHGDVIAQTNEGVTILSGDEIVARLGSQLGTRRVGICSSVPGVLDETGAVIEQINSLRTVEQTLGESEVTDVSGGMAGKVETLLEAAVPGSIFGLDDLPAFLAGESPGTTVQ